MLADLTITVQIGNLEPTVQLPGTARDELLDFIADELPRWRDHPARKPETSETVLTDQLCAHLNSAARIDGWSHVQFRTEVRDQIKHARVLDMTVNPCGAVLISEGRRHTQFDPLLPIECKRLPTPRESDRDEREYVVTAKGKTGGIQRFKFGLHAADHCVAAMIAYVQDRDVAYWLTEVNGWIRDLSVEPGSAWRVEETLVQRRNDPATGIGTFDSSHQRTGFLAKVKIRHLWINMN